MADGALSTTPAHIAVSVTGIAGPDGGSPEKPVGLVYLGVAAKGETTRMQECRFGDIGRCNIRLASVREALRLVQDAVKPGLPHDLDAQRLLSCPGDRCCRRRSMPPTHRARSDRAALSRRSRQPAAARRPRPARPRSERARLQRRHAGRQQPVRRRPQPRRSVEGRPQGRAPRPRDHHRRALRRRRPLRYQLPAPVDLLDAGRAQPSEAPSFAGANLCRARAVRPLQSLELPRRRSFAGATLAPFNKTGFIEHIWRTEFSGADLSNANLSGADLTYALLALRQPARRQLAGAGCARPTCRAPI